MPFQPYITALADARAFLDRVLDQVGDRWETSVYSDGAAWTVRQLAIHLATADKGQSNQVVAFAEGREVVPPDFDIERYNRRSVDKQADMTAEAARAALAAARADLLAFLASADDSILSKSGRHASLKILTVAELLTLMAAHERGHAEDIARVLAITV